MRRTLLVALYLLAPAAGASPISPLTLWELVERSDRIVLAEVVETARLPPGEAAVDWASHRARLRIVEGWKGEGPAEATVAYPGTLACPAPPSFVAGRRVLAFLAQERDTLLPVGLAAGTRSPSSAGEVAAYRTAVSEAIALQDPRRGRPVSALEWRAWHLRRMSAASTRWDGLVAFRGGGASWTDDELQVVSRAFIDTPPTDEMLRILLRALRPIIDPEVTVAGVSAFDAVLKGPRVPAWASDVLGLLRERLGADGPPKAPVDPLQTFGIGLVATGDARPPVVPERVRAEWALLKERFRLAPRPLRRAPGPLDALAGGGCESLVDSAEGPGRRDVPDPVSMLRVARSCAVAPEAVTSWFPRHELKVVMETARATDPEHVERVVGPRRCEVGAVLWSYREPVLVDWKGDEAYRVVWRPWSAPPVVFRVERTAGAASAVLKRDRVRGEALSGRFETLVRSVTPADFEAVRHAAEVAECWRPGHTCRAELSVEPRSSATDGNSWLLEGARKGEHWSVDVDDPRAGPFLDVAMAVVRAGGGEAWLTSVPE